MSSRTLTCIVFTIVIISVTLGCMGYYHYYSNRCIVSQPRECAGGWIHTNRPIFGSRTHDYYIKYRGQTQKSHEVCFVVKQVTESEYERLMYRGS